MIRILVLLVPLVLAAAEPQARLTILVDDGGAVLLDAVASTVRPGGYVARYRWDFGDGHRVVGEGAHRRHRYADGSYEVALEVIDDAGRAHRVTRTITVAGGIVTGGDGPIPTGPACHWCAERVAHRHDGSR